jgi:hypothetical protein
LSGTRRSGAKAPALVVTEWLRLRHAGDRLHHSLRRLHRRLQRARSTRAMLATLVSLACAVKILRPHLHRTRDALRASQDAGLDMEGLHRPTRRSCDNSGSDARINGEASAMVAML